MIQIPVTKIIFPSPFPSPRGERDGVRGVSDIWNWGLEFIWDLEFVI